MTTKTLSLTSFASLLVLALGFSLSNQQLPRDGHLRVSVDGPNGLERTEIERGSLTISGVDGSFQTRVALADAADGQAIQLALPAGVYGVQWNAGPQFEGETPLVEFSTPLRSTRLVVVAAERVSALNVNVPAASEGETFAANSIQGLGAALALR
jgi:hypothetical protein